MSLKLADERVSSAARLRVTKFLSRVYRKVAREHSRNVTTVLIGQASMGLWYCNTVKEGITRRLVLFQQYIIKCFNLATDIDKESCQYILNLSYEGHRVQIMCIVCLCVVLVSMTSRPRCQTFRRSMFVFNL